MLSSGRAPSLNNSETKFTLKTLIKDPLLNTLAPPEPQPSAAGLSSRVDFDNDDVGNFRASSEESMLNDKKCSTEEGEHSQAMFQQTAKVPSRTPRSSSLKSLRRYSPVIKVYPWIIIIL